MIPWQVWSQVQILVYQVVYGCCCSCDTGGCPRSSWLSNKLLASGYWLLSKGMWWTLWTCVFKFPFWEARYGQSWQQNGLSPEEQTHNAQIKLKGHGQAGEDVMHSIWRGQDVLADFKYTKDLTRHNDVNHGWDSLQGEAKRKGWGGKQTRRQTSAQTRDGI